MGLGLCWNHTSPSIQRTLRAPIWYPLPNSNILNLVLSGLYHFIGVLSAFPTPLSRFDAIEALPVVTKAIERTN